jgi:hypothetical protein
MVRAEVSTTGRVDLIRAAIAVVIAVLMGLASAGATSPSPSAPSPIQTPTASVRIGDIVWGPVDGTAEPVLGSTMSVPGASMGAGQVVAWSGGYAVLGDGVWVSPDGRAWTGYALPRRIDGQGVSLLTWHDALLLVEQRPRGRGWRFRLWSSTDGQEWQRAGTFDQRPVGRLKDCAFTYPHVVSTHARILAMADCVPYANGRVGPATAQLVGAAQASAPIVPIWAWTTDDGKRWKRHLVTDQLDPRGSGRSPVLVDAIGDGFAVILCCYPPTMWWSDDGASWREITALPDGVIAESVHALDAFIQDGRPVRWLLFADKDHEHPDDGLTGALGTLWSGDGSAWTEVVGRYDWQDGVIATDEGLAVAAALNVLELDELDQARVRLDTLASTDGGRTWELSEGEALGGEVFLGGIAMHGDRAFLAGPWGPDGVTLRRADLYGHIP